MLRTPYNNIKLSKVKTRGPEDGGNIGEWCRKITATVWTIAIGEPTPFGEIVASVATVFTAAGFIYEVILCKENEGNSDMDFAWKSTWAVRVLVMVTLILEGGDIQCVNDVLTIV